MPEAGDPTPGGHDRVAGKCEAFSCIRIKNTVTGSGRAQQGEGAVEGRSDNWGEVVTR